MALTELIYKTSIRIPCPIDCDDTVPLISALDWMDRIDIICPEFAHDIQHNTYESDNDKDCPHCTGDMFVHGYLCIYDCTT